MNFYKNKHTASEPKIGICDRCHEEKLVRAFKIRETMVMDGAATFGTVTKHFCDNCKPQKKEDKNAPPAPTDKAIKNLQKNMKKLLR